MDVKIDERTIGGVTILDIVGRLTIDEAAQHLRDKINSLVSQYRLQLVLNLGRVPYIDSGGLGQLVASYGSVKAWAELLGQDEITALLEQTLEEEEQADRKLSELAESTINAEAAMGNSEEQEENGSEDEEAEERDGEDGQCHDGSTSSPRSSARMCSIENRTIRMPDRASGT